MAYTVRPYSNSRLGVRFQFKASGAAQLGKPDGSSGAWMNPGSSTDMADEEAHTIKFFKGRGVGSNVPSRFQAWDRSKNLEHYEQQRTSEEPDELLPRRATEVRQVEARSILSYNDSPD